MTPEHHSMVVVREGFSPLTTIIKERSITGAKGLPPHSPLVYLLSFPQFLDAYGIMIMLFDHTDAQQRSQDSLILFDITSDYNKHLKKVCPKAFISF